MKPANPANWWINGNETVEFTYDPGHEPYSVVMQGKSYVGMCALFWADDEAHLRTLLHDMIAFARDARRQYVEAEPSKFGFVRDLHAYRYKQLDELEKCLNGQPSAYTLTIEPFDTGRPVKISWASNDTIL